MQLKIRNSPHPYPLPEGEGTAFEWPVNSLSSGTFARQRSVIPLPGAFRTDEAIERGSKLPQSMRFARLGCAAIAACPRFWLGVRQWKAAASCAHSRRFAR